MNFGDRKMQMSSEARARDEDLAHQRAARERLGDDLEADAARALDEHACRRARTSSARAPRRPRRRRRRASRRRSASAMRAARGPTVTSTSTPRSRACAPISAWKRRLVGPELEHVAEHRDAAPGRGRGEVVEGGAHRHRVGVVAVVDDDHRARELDPLAAQRRSSATSTGPRGSTPTARAAASAASALRRACGPGSRTAARCRRRASSTSPPGPKVTVVAGPSRRCGVQQRLAGRHDRRARPGAGRAISSALAAAIASSVPSSSRCTGPTLTITPTSGSAIAASSAICPAPRIAISSTSTSVPAGAPRIVSGRPISVLRFCARGDDAPVPARASRRGCPSSRSCRSSR